MDVVCFDVKEVPKGGAGGALAIRAVAGVAEERRGEEAVANGVADAAAGYAGEGFGFGDWVGDGWGILGCWCG